MIHFLLLGYLPIWAMKLFIAPGFGAGCGQLFIARADAYAKSGGHREISTSLHDGVKLPRIFRRAGFFTDLFDATEIATCRMYRGGAEVWQGFSKNATEGMATPIGLPIWTVLLAGGHVLPWLLLILGPPDALFPACVGIAVSLGTRIALAFRFGQNISNVSPSSHRRASHAGDTVVCPLDRISGTPCDMARAGISVQWLMTSGPLTC